MNDTHLPPVGMDAGGGSHLDQFQGLLDSWKPLNSVTPSKALIPPGELTRQLGPAQTGRQTGRFSVRAVIDMVTTDSTLIAQKLDDAHEQMALLERELKQARRSERMAAIEVLRAFVRSFEIKLDELNLAAHQPTDAVDGPSITSVSEPSSESAAEAGVYVGPSGQLWLGRGRHPTWLKRALQAGGTPADYWRPSSPQSLVSVDQLASLEA